MKNALKEHRTVIILGLIIAVSILLRLVSALYMGDKVQDLPGIFDQISYDRLAQNVAAGRGFSFDADWWPATRAGEPTAHWSYLMTLYLAGAYTIFGHHPLIPRLIQAVLAGVLMPLLTFLLAKKITNSQTALIAAAISAVYVYFFYYAAALMTEALFILAFLASLLLALNFADRPGWSRTIGLGVVMGLAILLKQLFLVLVPVILAWILYAAWGRVRLRYLLAVMLVSFLMILPWTIRNYFAFHQFVLLNTNAGFAFFWANHPIHGSSFYAILPDELPSYRELIPTELLSLDEASMEKALMKIGIQFVLDDPLRYVLLSISRVKDYFLFWPKATSGILSNISRVMSFGFFLPFMLYGLVLSLFSGKLERTLDVKTIDRRPYLLLYMVILVYTLIHILSWAYVRYRLPVDAVLIIFAAIGLYSLYQNFFSVPETSPHSA